MAFWVYTIVEHSGSLASSNKTIAIVTDKEEAERIKEELNKRFVFDRMHFSTGLEIIKEIGEFDWLKHYQGKKSPLEIRNLPKIIDGKVEGIRNISEIKERIKELFNMKLEQCVCTTRKDKTQGCDHCSNCMGFNDCIEELEWILGRDK